MTTIRQVHSRQDLKAFIEYPFAKYRADPHWVPPLLISEWEKFNPKKNPFFEHARMDLFLAEHKGRVVGRIAAIDNDLHNQTHQENLAFFGFFEAEDETAAQALLGKVEVWARRLNRKLLRGPVNPTMDDGSGLQIDAFDTSPYIMMPYNPATYPRYVEAANYAKVKDIYAWLFDADKGLPQHLSRLAQRVQDRYKPTVRKVDLKHFDRELAILKDIYNKAWEKNWGFVKLTEAEFDKLANDLKLLIDPDIALFLEISGEVVGIAIALPDANQVFKRINGRLLPFGIFQLLNRKKIITQARLAILGLMPQHRHKGLELVMINEIFKNAVAKGYQGGECSWVLEDNDAMNKGIAASGAKLYKTYRLYEKVL